MPTTKRGFLSFRAIIALSVVGLATVAIVLMSRSGGTGQARLDVHVVARETFEVTATASGELRAKNQTAIRNELENEASIVEIVEEGSFVKKGDLLVKLNDDEIRTQLDEEMLQRETARAEAVAADNDLKIQLTENDASLKKAQTDVVLADVELQKFEAGDAVEKRLELNLAVEKGQRETKRLTDKVERSRELYKRDFLSKDELDKDELELIEAQAELEQANVALKAYEDYTYKKERKKLESELDQSKAELEKTLRKNESDLASKEADLTNKRRQLELREAKVAELEAELTKTEMLAPTDGLVVYATSLEQFMWMNNEQPLNVGTTVHPNQEIIMLPDTSEMVAAVKVHESLVGRIRPGQRAIVAVDAAQGRKFTGSVESIGIMAKSGGWRDPNVREYEVRIALDLPDEKHGLKPSMRCEGRITLMDVPDVIAVPLTAVFSEGPNQFVYVVKGDDYIQTQVRVGRRSDITAEIAKGLDAGQRVALREPPAANIVKATFEPMPQGGPPSAMMTGGAKGHRPPQPDTAAPPPEAKPPKEAKEPAPEEPATDEATEDIAEDEDAASDEEETKEGAPPAESESAKKGNGDGN